MVNTQVTKALRMQLAPEICLQDLKRLARMHRTLDVDVLYHSTRRGLRNR